MNSTAKVSFYNRARGWGFAVPNVPGNDVFLHASNLPADHKYLNEGDDIGYTPGERNGKPLALNVRIIKEAPTAVVEPQESR